MQRIQTRKSASPTAQLLRSSRLFSLPEPLPRPVTARNRRNSPNATLPYPIYQAIETPPSSLSRGDFGLKRPLPLKKLEKTSNPVIRVIEQDAIEKLTDYEFATDHTQTLKKLQELNLSIRFKDRAGRIGSVTDPVSAFDSSVDNTIQVQQTTSRLGEAPTQWKHSRTSLLHQTDLGLQWDLKRGFQIDVNENGVVKRKTVRGKELSEQFTQYLRRKILESHQRSVMGAALQDGEDPSPSDLELSEDDYQGRIRALRDDFKQSGSEDASGSKLADHITAFLDLPPVQKTEFRDNSDRKYMVIDSTGHRSTHPSAGVSYLRTHSVYSNHPLLGPQEKSSPIEARVLRQNVQGQNNARTVLGVAGIADVPDASRFLVKGAFEPTAPGGKKVWVTPNSMSVAENGSIRLGYGLGDEPSIAIKNGQKPPQNEAAGRFSSYRNAFSPRQSAPRLDQRRNPSGADMEDLRALEMMTGRR